MKNIGEVIETYALLTVASISDVAWGCLEFLTCEQTCRVV